MKRLEFTIPGEPISQGRPRFSTHGGFARAYDPKKSRNILAASRTGLRAQAGFTVVVHYAYTIA